MYYSPRQPVRVISHNIVHITFRVTIRNRKRKVNATKCLARLVRKKTNSYFSLVIFSVAISETLRNRTHRVINKRE